MNRASIFGRTLGPSLAAGVAVVLALPSAAQLLATDPLLLLSAPVDPGQRIALSLPGVPFASDWSGLLGPALRGSPDGRGGDQLVFWIAPEQRYEAAFKLDATGRPELDGAMFTADTGNAGFQPAPVSRLLSPDSPSPAATPKPGDAFWVENRGTTPATISLPLRLNRAPVARLPLSPGLNVLGSPYATPVFSGTVGQGGKSAASPSASDLTPKSTFPATEPWWETAGEDPAPAEFIRPYDDDLPAMPGAPMLAGAEVSGDRNDALLDVPAAGTLELFHQRIDPARGFQSIGAWTLVQTLKAEAGPLRLRLPPSDALPGNTGHPLATLTSDLRPPTSSSPPPVQIDAWIAVAFIDTDRDGASDAAEVLQNFTNPLDPKNAMPRDGDPLADWRALVKRGHFDAMMRHPETQVVFVDPKSGDDRLDGSRSDLGDARSGCGPKRTIASAVAGRSGTLVLDLAPGVHPLPDSGLPRYEGTLTYNTSRGPVHFATPDVLSRRGQQLLSPGSTKP
jgi:hypothetical protein